MRLYGKIGRRRVRERSVVEALALLSELAVDQRAETHQKL